MKVVAIYILFLLLLTGCQNNPKAIIRAYENTEHAIHISRFISIGPLEPFFAHDSILILDTEYELAYNQKIQGVQKQLDERILERQRAEIEVQSSQNPLMKSAISNKIKLIQNEEVTLNKILTLYSKNPEKTQLNVLTKERMRYAEFPDSIIAYTLKVTFKGRIGKLDKEEFERTYLFNDDKSKLIGLLQP